MSLKSYREEEPFIESIRLFSACAMSSFSPLIAIGTSMRHHQRTNSSNAELEETRSTTSAELPEECHAVCYEREASQVSTEDDSDSSYDSFEEQVRMQQLALLQPRTTSKANCDYWADPPSEVKPDVDLSFQLQGLLLQESWNEILSLLQNHPQLSRQVVLVHCRGERTPCLPLHAVVAHRAPSMDITEALVSMHPAALWTPDAVRGRCPLHFALLKGASHMLIRYLCQRHPAALHFVDDQGNTPLHYACQLASEATCRLLLDMYPAACQISNSDKRLPLHLLCAREWDTARLESSQNDSSQEAPIVVSLGLLEMVRQAHPAAVSTLDRNGRLPLHWAACQNRGDILQWLVPHYSAGLLQRDASEKTPLELAKLLKGGVVAAFLKERTAKERRARIFSRKRRSKPEMSLYHCYG